MLRCRLKVGRGPLKALMAVRFHLTQPKGSDDLCKGDAVRNCHSVRSHPEVAQQDWGAMHKFEKKQIHKKVRKYYKNQSWLRGAIADTESLNLSQLRVQLPS